jgi:hypothetical protein
MKATTSTFSRIARKALMVMMAAALVTSCKKKKETVQAPPAGEVLINEYCAGPEFFSNNEFFRSNGIGESMDQATAKKKAFSNARADLASSINTTIKGTIDNYVNSREFNNREEVEERFEGLTREVINQQLNGTKTICQKVVRVTSNNNFKYYVALELSGQELLKAMNNRLSKDERLRIDYDYEKFKETFEKEMERLGNN